MGPAELVQATAIARQYYLEGMTKIEIADAHGLSRYKVARILEACLAEGLVRIEIAPSDLVDADLSTRLARHMDLRNALVVDGDFTDTTALRQGLGRAAAALLQELVGEDDVLGVAWGRTLDAMAGQVERLPRCKIVQLTGIAGAVRASSVDLVRQLSAASGGPSFPLYAPLVVSDRTTADSLRRQPMIQSAIRQWQYITVAVVAVGSWDTQGSQLFAALSPQDRQVLHDLPVAAEMCSNLYDADGAPLHTSLSPKSVAIDHASLANVPEVIAVAGGMEKLAAISSVLRSGAVTSLVTDAAVARELLRIPAASKERDAPPRRRSRSSKDKRAP